MTSLTKRPRVRRVLVAAANRVLHATASVEPAAPPAPDPTPPVAPPPLSPESFARAVAVGSFAAAEEEAVTNRLFAALDAEDIAEVERRIAETPEASADYGLAPNEGVRRFLLLTYGIWLGVPAAAAKTGLGSAQPPEDIHAMARGRHAAAGGLYEADLVIDALTSAGVEITSVSAALDFGCSSARVIRVLHAAYPEIEWHGCDPNERAIAWARENLPGIDFFVNGDHPPLHLADASLDLIYAISIWSHFAPELGLRWFDEMRRLIRPGGHLVCTTHGLTSVAHYALGEMRTAEQSQEITEALYRQGSWYAPEFGEEGDWGVVNPAWGTAFLSPEWMLTQLCPHWRVLEFAPGRNQYNQDVYVLERA